MPGEWLDIQNFVCDQDALLAINDLAIATHFSLEGVQVAERTARAEQARLYLRHFLSELGNALRDRRADPRATGGDPRVRELAESFESAPRDDLSGALLDVEDGPAAVARLLDADDTESMRRLLSSLDVLRDIVTRHRQSNHLAIVGDF